MKRNELKQLIREVMNEFAPLGVAEENNSFSKYAYAKKGKWVKGGKKPEADDGVRTTHNGKKYRYDKVSGEDATHNVTFLKEKDQGAEHDETDISNPEEAREVELAIQIKALADEILGMHGTNGEDSVESKEVDGEETDTEESEK